MLNGWILEAILGIPAGKEAANKAVAKLSLDERSTRVSDALRTRFGSKDGEGRYNYDVWPIAVYDETVIFRKPVAGQTKSGTFQIELTWSDEGAVELKGDPVAVVQTWKPMKEAIAFVDTEMRFAESSAGGGALVRIESEVVGPVYEADGKTTGLQWEVILIREGMSKNRNNYTKKVLAEAITSGLYEGRPMFVDHKLDTGPFGRSGNEAVGFSKNVRSVLLYEGEGKEAKVSAFAVGARACLIDESFARKVVNAHSLGNPNLFGLSHDARCESVTAQNQEGAYYDITAIKRVESTDWVLSPAAGGRVLRHVASDTLNPQLLEDGMTLKALLEALAKAGVTVPANCDEPTAIRLLNEALVARAAVPPPVTPPATPPPVATTEAAVVPPVTGAAATTLEAALARIQALETSNTAGARTTATLLLDRSLLECSLPEPFVKRIRKHFETLIAASKYPTQDDIAAHIAIYVEDTAAMREANLVMPHVGVPRVQITQGRAEKVQEQLAKFFDISESGTSFKEIYISITGDSKVNGRITDDVRHRLSEALGRSQESLTTASFDQILGDSITRRMLKDYAATGLANWKNTIGEVVPLNDFRTVRRLRFGGYGNLSIVAQSAPYTALTSPTDEEATYSPAKRGGTEQVTLEMIKNDDVGAIRRIPGKLARAAAQTLHEFVWDMLQNNSAIYDTVNLSAVGHTNIVTTALSASNISALRLKIKQQADMSNAKRLGLNARYLIVPGELEELAFQLTTSDKVTASANNDPNFIKKLNLETIVVEYWTDVNNYWVTASVDQAPMLEVGFLDGQETPELFVADNPTVGSMFSNDQLTWKIRHIYGGAVMDFRPFSAGIVA